MQANRRRTKETYVIARLVRRLVSHELRFEPDDTNWSAWRNAVRGWRLSSERTLQEKASAALVARRAER